MGFGFELFFGWVENFFEDWYKLRSCLLYGGVGFFVEFYDVFINGGVFFVVFG